MNAELMSETPVRTTQLEAVNTMLSVIGEQPVNSLAPPSQQVVEAVVAYQTLMEQHRAGQARGWHWNVDKDFPLYKDASTGFVPVPQNAHQVVITPEMERTLVCRGERVWDKVRHTYLLTQDKVAADIVWMLPWEECPEPFNRWVLCSAARLFAARVLTDQEVVGLSRLDEQAAWTELQRHETRGATPNALHGGGGRFPTYDPSELGLQARGRLL